MKKKKFVNTEEFRMKMVNMLKIYGYYDGVLVEAGNEKDFIDGILEMSDVINNKKDFKELKRSILKVLDYCYENNYDNLVEEVKYFYFEMGKNVRKKFGNFFERI